MKYFLHSIGNKTKIAKNDNLQHLRQINFLYFFNFACIYCTVTHIFAQFKAYSSKASPRAPLILHCLLKWLLSSLHFKIKAYT